MRFVDQEELKPAIAHLLPALDDATTQVLAESDPLKRKEIINRNQPAWVALREEMLRLSHGKCWYTESRNLGTDEDVDHFRPKLRVTGLRNHPGYYWLAFDWQNYRLSCHHSNRPRRGKGSSAIGGKGSKFPLLDEVKRAFSEADDWRAEEPTLLDPCDPDDPAILTFWPNGESALAPECENDPIAAKRWKESRITLHIDWPDFIDARLQLYNKVSRLIDRGARERPAEDARSTEAFKDVVRDLLALMKESSEFSAAARVYVESFSDVWWVRRIVLKVG